jgi:uncharacterized membrane protein
MRYLIEYHQSGRPPSRWRALLQQILAWLALAAFVALVVTLAVFFFSIIAAVVAALLIVGAIAAVVMRVKYGSWPWPTRRV